MLLKSFGISILLATSLLVSISHPKLFRYFSLPLISEAFIISLIPNPAPEPEQIITAAAESTAKTMIIITAFFLLSFKYFANILFVHTLSIKFSLLYVIITLLIYFLFGDVMPVMRLDKFISDCKIASRKTIKQMVKQGRFAVDGAAAVSPEMKIDPEKQTITLDGKPVKYVRYHYFMLNKPTGVLSATDDNKQNTVIDLLSDEDKKLELFPVGRLDKDTTGLLLITDDGDFAHRIISPKSEIVKKYYAEVEGTLKPEFAAEFEQGITLADGTECLPAKLEILDPNSCYVYVMEGKYHQVKRMLASCGTPVKHLKRLQIGELELDKSLKEGEYRALSEKELCMVHK